jgi:hypothetical protein
MKHDDFLKFDYGTNKKQIFDILVAQIDVAISEKRAHVYIKKLKIVDDELDIIAESKDWPDCLTKALTFYKQIEDYESCSKCQKLLDKITSKTKKRTTKSNG